MGAGPSRTGRSYRDRAGPETGPGAPAIQPVRAAARGIAVRVQLTFGPGASPGPSAQTKDSYVVKGKPVAPVVAARARAARAGSTQDWRNTGSLAAAPPFPKGTRRRSRGAAPPRATQAGLPNGQLRLLLRPGRLTCGQRRAVSTGVDRTCNASLPGLRPSPPTSHPVRRQARAAHLEPRGCGSRGSEDPVSSHLPGGRRWSERGSSVKSGARRRHCRPSSRRVPEIGRTVPALGEEAPAAGHHERRQRQHHLRKSQAAETRAENVSVRSESSRGGWALRLAGAEGDPTASPVPRGPVIRSIPDTMESKFGTGSRQPSLGLFHF